MRRTVMEADHEAFRSAFREFVNKEIGPRHDAWEQAKIVPRDVWETAGAHGYLCMNVPEAYGGGGSDDYRFLAVVSEELARAGASGVGFPMHTDIVVPYLLAYGTEQQKRRWLPAMAAGKAIGALAMTEPGAGSDLAGIRTTALRDGDHYVLSGQKTFITNGINADLVLVAARTDPDERHDGLSLFVVERGMKGFTRGRNLDKIGMHAQDTAELFFDQLRIPATNLVGQEGQGFAYMVNSLPQERLVVAVGSVALAEAVLERTTGYCRERTAFGRPIGTFQHSRFTLAEMHTEVEIARVFVDRCITAHLTREFGVTEAAMAKWWTTDLLNRVVDRCLQLHGGYGYMREHPIARAFVDARVQSIYAGTNEIMKEIIGRTVTA
ncbi:acyl-CoA dehydrogenase family protein [Nonomuraea diastatica]|uniref:Acyl-[acyl-carrier-protein] dehydrogenase MbtN n=1 Tax=Nonomuraea diastatica TaxID=1848329 RepID=A0A4V2YFW2_9ACTN|nr:acyl-CoA dehydrogenase family protein [Nonomuraea diastatica]TDD24777.1 acyl-CoA dehydrogenase [Nonomuraea diastatica]